MQSSYQYHFGGQAAAAKSAFQQDSPNKSPGVKAAAASTSASSSMFTPKVDWGTGPQGAAASNRSTNNPVAYGFGGSSVSFGGMGAINSGNPAVSSSSSQRGASFGGPTSAAAASSSVLSSQGSSRAGAAASFGGPSASGFGAPSASFGGGSASGIASGLGFSTSNWSAVPTGEHVTTSTSVKEYSYQEDRNIRFRPQMEDSKFPSSPPNQTFLEIS